MANWYLTVHLSDLWRGDNLPFEEKRDRIAARLQTSRWGRITGDSELLKGLIEELQEAADVREFDLVLDALYDLADDDRVWIETRGTVVTL